MSADDDDREPVLLAYAECFVCHQLFLFDPDRVPSIPIRRGRADPPGEREPICRRCVEAVNPERIAKGLDPIPILPGAYPHDE